MIIELKNNYFIINKLLPYEIYKIIITKIKKMCRSENKKIENKKKINILKKIMMCVDCNGICVMNEKNEDVYKLLLNYFKDYLEGENYCMAYDECHKHNGGCSENFYVFIKGQWLKSYHNYNKGSYITKFGRIYNEYYIIFNKNIEKYLCTIPTYGRGLDIKFHFICDKYYGDIIKNKLDLEFL